MAVDLYASDRMAGKVQFRTNLIILSHPLILGYGKECGFEVFRGDEAFGEGLTS